MIITNIQLVPSNVPFNVYYGITSATTTTLVASGVTTNFQFNINPFELYDTSISAFTQYFYLRFVSEHCEDLIVKVKGLNIEDFTTPSCVETYLKYAEAVGLTTPGVGVEVP
jgi:Sec7-like guanine-nucleotide exchange factor